MTSRNFKQVALLILLAVVAAGGIELLRDAQGSGDWLLSLSIGWFATLALYAVIAGIAGLAIVAEIARPGLVTGWASAHVRIGMPIPPPVRWLAVATLVALPSLLLLGPWGRSVTTPALRSMLLIVSAGAAAQLAPRETVPAFGRFLLAGLAAAVIFVVAKRLVQVTGYPFKLAWSEGNRLWDYSLYFRWDQYQFPSGASLPGYMAPGRHGLWGLPFLIPNLSIAVERMWDAMLWIVPYLALGWGLARLYGGGWPGRHRVWAVLWVLLFLTSGGIFAPLALSACLIVWGYRPRRVVRSMILAAIASCYAGLSRWTWLLAPGAWGVMLVLLGPGRDDRPAVRLRHAVGVGLAGLLGGLASQGILAAAFPQPNSVFSTALSQPLLWYRMLPSPTNAIGVVPGLLLATVPLLGLVLWAARRKVVLWTALEQGFLALLVLALTGAGLAASAKIGGGSNLHNADMLLMTLLLLVGIVVGWAGGDRVRLSEQLPDWGRALVVLALVVPTLDAVRTGSLPELPTAQVTDDSLAVLQQQIRTAADHGPVLFIDQRQLFTFGQIDQVPMVMEYELKDMMNQALSSNEAYFQQFRADLQRRRFALIVSDPLPGELQGRAHQFGEENDAWYTYVATPLREYYRPLQMLDEVGIWLLVPAAPPPP